MLDQITQIVKEQASGFLSEQNIPADKWEDTTKAASESIFDSLKNQALSGNLEGITNMFSSGENDDSGNAAMGNIMETFSSKISGLGFSSDQVSGLTSSFIPSILKMISGKFSSEAEEDAGFDLGDIMGMLSGGDQGDIMGKAKDLLGGFFGK